jgi:hypothetical protein
MTGERDLEPRELAVLAAATAARGERLRALGVDRRCQALAAAAAELADCASPLGGHARRVLPVSSGHSPEMVDWALRSALGEVDAKGLAALFREAAGEERAGAAERRCVPPRLVTAVLAGNVFTASLRPIVLALLAGSPLVCKASSRGDAFPRLFEVALTAVDPEVGAALAVATFPGGTEELEDALFRASDAVIVYGGDPTVEVLRRRLPATVRLQEHGHGLGVAWVTAAVLANPQRAAEAAERLALDVAAYDQRGCLSPQVLWLEDRDLGGEKEGRRFLALLAEALERQDRLLPRGFLPPEIAAAQMQWRGVMATAGELWAGGWGAVVWIADRSAPLHLGPGWRNLLVLPCTGAPDLARRLTPFGVHLKAVGVGGDPEALRRLADLLPPPLCPRLCPLGRMQIPPLTGLADGAPPFEALLRWQDVETELT